MTGRRGDRQLRVSVLGKRSTTGLGGLTAVPGDLGHAFSGLLLSETASALVYGPSLVRFAPSCEVQIPFLSPSGSAAHQEHPKAVWPPPKSSPASDLAGSLTFASADPLSLGILPAPRPCSEVRSMLHPFDE